MFLINILQIQTTKIRDLTQDISNIPCYNELNLNIGKVIKDIPKETYKNLLIGLYKRDIVYVKTIKKIK